MELARRNFGLGSLKSTVRMADLVRGVLCRCRPANDLSLLLGVPAADRDLVDLAGDRERGAEFEQILQPLACYLRKAERVRSLDVQGPVIEVQHLAISARKHREEVIIRDIIADHIGVVRGSGGDRGGESGFPGYLGGDV